MAEDQTWRLKAELDTADVRGALERLLGRLRGPDVVRDISAAVAPDVVITHDGRLLFAYADSEDALARARSAIEPVLARDGVAASIVISHWDTAIDEWRQTDPPLSGEAQRIADQREHEKLAVETRTIVASLGKEIRMGFEQSLLESAKELGIECEIIEHPHLLTTQTAFTVTGPRRKIDEFDQGLKAEEWQTMRAERAVMSSPL